MISSLLFYLVWLTKTFANDFAWLQTKYQFCVSTNVFRIFLLSKSTASPQYKQSLGLFNLLSAQTAQVLLFSMCGIWTWKKEIDIRCEYIFRLDFVSLMNTLQNRDFFVARKREKWHNNSGQLHIGIILDRQMTKIVRMVNKPNQREYIDIYITTPIDGL